MLLAVAGGSQASEAVAPSAGYQPIRVDLLEARAIPDSERVTLLAPPDAATWPAAVHQHFRDRVRTEWSPSTPYGAIERRIGGWFEYPLVTLLPGGEAAVPLVSDLRLNIRGRLVLPVSRPDRRVAVLLDLSHSTQRGRARILQGEAPQRISVHDGVVRTLELLAEAIERDRAASDAPGYTAPAIAVIPYGERIWGVYEGPLGEQLRSGVRDLSIASHEAGRTDTVCALWTAHDWLEQGSTAGPKEIVIVTDRDLPHSGRFETCQEELRRGGASALRCLERVNTSACPASHVFSAEGGRSDVAQLFHFARTVRDVRISAVLFGPGRPPRVLRELTRYSGGELERVVFESQLSHLVTELLGRTVEISDTRRLIARNTRTGSVTGDLLGPDGVAFSGDIGLVPGSNDVEIFVDGAYGREGWFRFRVFAAERPLESFLEGLRADVETLRSKLLDIVLKPHPPARALPNRRLEIAPDPQP